MLSATIGPTSGTSSSCSRSRVAAASSRRSGAPGPWPSSRRRGGCRGRRESAPASSCLLRSMSAMQVGARSCRPCARAPSSCPMVERVEVGQRCDHAAVDELVDELLAQAFDVERAPAGEMQDRLLALRGAEQAAACSGSRPRPSRARPRCRTPGTAARHAEVRHVALRRRARGTHADHLGDHVAGAAHDHGVADAHALAAHLEHRCAASRSLTVVPPTNTGSSLATGVSLPVRPTWISIALQARRLLLRRVLLRHRPARLARLEAEPLLQRAVVDLVDDAVDVERQRRRAAPRRPRGRRPARRRPRRRACIGLDRQAHRRRSASSSAASASAGSSQPCDLAQAVGEEAERPLGGDCRRRAGAPTPAAALRGLTKVFSFFAPPSISLRCRSLSASKSSRRMKTSPRTSSTGGASRPCSRFGIGAIVRTFCVTSSPVSPSPRVAACTSTPCS